jgi:hypothetical protein
MVRATLVYRCKNCGNYYPSWYEAQTCHNAWINKSWKCAVCNEIYFNIYDAFNCCYDKEVSHETVEEWLHRNYPRYDWDKRGKAS